MNGDYALNQLLSWTAFFPITHSFIQSLLLDMLKRSVQASLSLATSFSEKNLDHSRAKFDVLSLQCDLHHHQVQCSHV